MFQTEFIEKIKTHILCSITFFLGGGEDSCHFLDNVERYLQSDGPKITIQ